MSINISEVNGVRIAVEGCCHGELDKIYETLQYIEQQDARKIDLLICCGDFQAVRNLDDLECMACPPKYRQLQTFYKYYSGQKVAPYPTLFIGGNHEAANYLWELYYGGWAAPNIYFLGYAGVVNFAGIRIAGLSGIYKSHHYDLGHYERPPYTADSLRSAYHVRRLEIHRLSMLEEGGGIDIFISHDWPAGIAHYGNKAALVGHKPFLEREIEDGSLGSAPAAELLHLLRPKYWFSAHLHTKFAAIVSHPPTSTSSSSSSTTKFLALSKCLPGQRFLQVIDLPSPQQQQDMNLDSTNLDSTSSSSPCVDKSFSYDPEWLAILKHTHHLLSLSPGRIAPTIFHNNNNNNNTISQQAIQEARAMIYKVCPGGKIPNNFIPTAAAHKDNDNGGGRGGGRRMGAMPAHELRNRQTEQFLGMIGLEYNLDHPAAPSGGMFGGVGMSSGGGLGGGVTNPEEIELLDADDDEEEEEEGEGGGGKVIHTAIASVIGYTEKKGEGGGGDNPEEVELKEEDA